MRILAGRRGLLVLALVALAVVTPSRDVRGELLTIDDCEYTPATVSETWQAVMGTPPVRVMSRPAHGGRSAVRIDCPFSGDTARSVADCAVRLDLSRAMRIRFDLYVENARAISKMTVYLRSGKGWYRGDCPDFGDGWQTVEIERVAVRAEGSPAGWHGIDTIRFSPWKGADEDTFIGVDRVAAELADETDLVLVIGSNAVSRRHSEARAAQSSAQVMGELFRDLGLRYLLLDDHGVARGRLAGSRVAVFAYSPVLTQPEIDAIRTYVQDGGRMFFFYALPKEIGEILGVRRTGWARQKYDGNFAEIRFGGADISGLPERVRQRSWNINVAEPVDRNARVIASWHDSSGKSTGRPAVILSDAGVYVSHVLLSADRGAAGKMMLALLGRFLPAVWSQAAEAAVERVGHVSPLRGFDDLRAWVEGFEPKGARVRRAEALIARALLLQQQAARAAKGKQYLDAIRQAEAAAESAVQAYRLCQHSHPVEFRGVWEHSGTSGIEDWEQAMAVLARANFNAVVPNMLWGGCAHYESRLLPPTEVFREKGDQIARCVAAAKRHGIEVHVWKVNWRLGRSPKEFVSRMRAEKRMQVNARGEALGWLCPSHPENRKLELDSMLEVARNYDVDGLHFDYIRYPGPTACFCDGCRERFRKETGQVVKRWPQDVSTGPLKQAWLNWRCANITRLVKAVSDEARKIRPGIRISAAVFPNPERARRDIGQDWLTWVREGYVDFVCPMNYIRGNRRFSRTVARQVELVGGRVPVYSGIGVLLRHTLTPEETIVQINLAREAGARGFCLFNFGPLMAAEYLPALAEGVTGAAAKTPHSITKETER